MGGTCQGRCERSGTAWFVGSAHPPGLENFSFKINIYVASISAGLFTSEDNTKSLNVTLLTPFLHVLLLMLLLHQD